MLHLIQKQIKSPKSQYNNFGKYKYRTCEDIIEAVKPLLPDGATLTMSDEIKEVAGIVYVEATAVFKHKDELVEVKAQAGIDPNKKGMDIAQSFGASSSYARKYALNGLLLIDDTKDSDSQKPSTITIPKMKAIDPKELDIISKDLAECNKENYGVLKAKYSRHISEFPSVKALFQAKYQNLK